MAQATNDNLLAVTFESHPVINDAKSVKMGRPIFDDVEICVIRFVGDNKKVGAFPAHEAEPNATREKGFPVTYAEHYNTQYMQFKNGLQQTVAGTPLSEAPFLTEGKRRELRALNIHSVEALAALDGPNMKMLGMGGREWKNQAVAFLSAASGTADFTGMAAEIARLKERLAIAEASTPPAGNVETERSEKTELSIEDCTDEQLHASIKEQQGGKAMPANTGRAKLLERATELAQAEAA